MFYITPTETKTDQLLQLQTSSKCGQAVTGREPGNSSKVEIYHQNYVALNCVKRLALSRVLPNGTVISKLVEYFELVNK